MSLLTHEVYYHSDAAEGSTQAEVTQNQWQDGTSHVITAVFYRVRHWMVLILANDNYLMTLITSFPLDFRLRQKWKM